MLMAEKNNDDERKRVMTFVAQELPKFSIKRFNLQNVFDFNNNRPWPVKNSSVAHRLRNPVLDVSTIKINFCVKLAIYLPVLWCNSLFIYMHKKLLALHFVSASQLC